PLLTSLDNPPRLSLAGAQLKFAVYKQNNIYYRSDDEHPTTHIIKITNRRFPDLLENELFCMRLAQTILLDIPNVKLMDADGCPYLEIERFDRVTDNGTVCRVHQEDFCQALGIVSAKKYQSGGGPGLKDCYGIIDKYSKNHISDVTRFIEWTVFNYLIGNTDAHAKNISLLHMESGIKLAPFYDLLSTEVYPQKLVDHYTAMLINGKGKYTSVCKNDFTALFEQLKLNPTNMMRLVNSKFANTVKTAESLRDELNSHTLLKTNVYDSIIDTIKKRWAVLFAG
ncbi:MAG: HipA domain-containing protein, partial [Treponema sp.]|nr:HipA domain-containing protein [Treponema sp.]